MEQVQMKNDGSGSFQLTLNLSKSKTKLNSILKLKTVNGHPVPTKEEITNKINDAKNTLAKTDGISNVKTTIDFENYIFSISYDFNSVANLNKAIKTIKLKEKVTGNLLDDNYAYDATTKTFQRKNNADPKTLYAKMSNADKEVLSDANYTCIYKFESDITTFTNKDAKLSANKKAVMLKQSMQNILTGKKSIENKINITKQ
ncbi:hypothetical protein [Ferruginibacter albus]|uniref:hypothetical protein n=1 Tax=Ferruginibacter albus TaxID=2875540 RepID=UPI001CC6D985|nr:hypothetical protein [Ferruginibacter albus]UAY50910.1 hypothetical protein K9M53_09940 [Ferruginibacter albus]